jgi:hypothetical protein
MIWVGITCIYRDYDKYGDSYTKDVTPEVLQVVNAETILHQLRHNLSFTISIDAQTR